MRPTEELLSNEGLRRRQVLAGIVAGAGLLSLSPLFLGVSDGEGGETTPFPSHIPLYAENYENWSRELQRADVPTFAPRRPHDVLRVANWCAKNGFRMRPRGMRHGWSPLTISAASRSDIKLILADTSQYLNRAELTLYHGIPAVRAEVGVTMDDLMAFLDQNGYGFTAIPEIGQLSVGGVLAINGHGTGLPAIGEAPLPQQTYGSMSNRVLEMTALIWDEDRQAFRLRRFDRRHRDIAALLTQLGRSFITEAVLAVEPNHKLRCQSRVDIPASELFGPPHSRGRTASDFLDQSGRFVAFWYPYTDGVWLRIWTPTPHKPRRSRKVDSPYNYFFTSNLPAKLSDLVERIISGHTQLGPLFSQLSFAGTAVALATTNTYDLWGSAKNTLLYIEPETLRATQMSYAILTRRANVQQVLHEFSQAFQRRLNDALHQKRYPVNLPLELRVSGLDWPDDIGFAHARTPLLSAISPVASQPQWDAAVWIGVITLTDTPDQYAFFHDLEQWLLQHFNGDDAMLRPEWSKGWAYSDTASWVDAELINEGIPAAYRDGKHDGDWDTAIRILDRHDPLRIFSNDFLDSLL